MCSGGTMICLDYFCTGDVVPELYAFRGLQMTAVLRRGVTY